MEALVTYWKKAAKKNSSYYLMAGTAFERTSLLCGARQRRRRLRANVDRGEGLRLEASNELAKNNAEVVNLNPGDLTIDGAADALKDKYKTTLKTEDTAELSKIRGNIVLLGGTVRPKRRSRAAASSPRNSPGKTPEQLVDMLVKKGLAEDYSGRLDLSGCFTASGGPAAAEKDKTYAEKVLSVLHKKATRRYPSRHGRDQWVRLLALR